MNGRTSRNETEERVYRLERELEDLRRQNERLKISERKFRRMFMHASEYLYCHDLEGNFTDVNASIRRAGGYTEEELLGMNIREALSPRFRDDFERYRERILEHGRDEGRVKVVGRDGSERIIEYHNILMTDAGGTPYVQGIARDITGRLLEEKSRILTEARYRSILETIEEGYYEVDLAGNLTFFNESMCRILGYSKDELIGMNNRRYMTQADAEKVYKAFNRVYRTGQTVKALDWKLIRKDGSSIYIEVSVSLIRDEAGAPVGFKGIFRDINKRKKAEEDIRKSEERYRTILESIEDGYYEVDLKGDLTFFNDAMCRLTGYSREELMGMNNRRYMDPAVAREIFETVNRVYRTGKPHRGFGWSFRRKDGVANHIEASVSLMHDEEGRRVGFRGIVRDVTERKRIEEELLRHRDHLEDLVEERAREVIAANAQLRKEIEERMRAEEELSKSREEYRELYESSRQREEVYRSLLHSSADAIVLYDLEGRTRYLSPSFTRIFGWTLDEVRNKPMPFVPEKEKGRTMAIVKALKERGTSFQGFETKRLTKDGRLLDVSISTSRYNDHEDRPSGILVVLRDITDTRKLQAQLQHAQKMESIGTIASGVAHNFRNILAGISVNSQLLQMKHGEDPALRDIAGRLNRYVKRGTHLVEGLMQFARKPRGDSFRNVDLVELLTETQDLISQSFDRKIEIHVSLPDTLPVLGDDPALRQVFMNLSTNARDAMPAGGTLVIRAEKKGGRAEVEFTDTGEGMDAETRKKCFDPFYTTKEVNAGTGLGLSTSYGIVKQHGGDIHIYSEVGQGTTFRVILPLAVLDIEQDHDADLPVPVSGEGRRILVVDDEEGMLLAMKELLGSLGYEVVAVRSGSNAIQTYRTCEVDVVIMDRNMPGMDGVTCMEKLLELDPRARVVLISGYDQEGPHGIDEHTREVMAGYLTKPVDLMELSQLVRRLLESQG